MSTEPLSTVTADMLEYGNLFVYTTLSSTIYGIRTHCFTFVDDDNGKGYTNLLTGEFEWIPLKEPVEKFDSVIDFVVHFYKSIGSPETERG